MYANKFVIDKFYKDPNNTKKVISIRPNVVIKVIRDLDEVEYYKEEIKEEIKGKKKTNILLLYVPKTEDKSDITIPMLVGHLKALCVREINKSGLDINDFFIDVSPRTIKLLTNTEYLTLPRVLNKRFNALTKDSVYIGRPSKYGNPFSHLDTKGTVKVECREEAVDEYLKYFLDLPKEEREDIISDLKGKDLVCWCSSLTHPTECHGDILVKYCN